MSHFELELIEKIAQRTTVIIHYTTSKFNTKMQERFKAMGIELPNEAHVSFDLTTKTMIASQNNEAKIHARVISVEERQEQIAVAFVQIE